jgi:hypothetical protein
MTATRLSFQARGIMTDLEFLKQLGVILDHRMSTGTVRDWLISQMLKIRLKGKGTGWLKLNQAQQEYSARCGQKNIVLKARQLGVTTYVAARFFIQTITRPGTLTVQVAHTEESAEAIFAIVRRFWENLPMQLRRGALRTSRSNVRQLVFPGLDSEYRVETAEENAGRGMTIHHLHCSEVSCWPRGGRDTLAALRGAVVPNGEIVLESTPRGAVGVFYEEWQKAAETGYTKHFFPWWYDKTYREKVRGKVLAFTEEEAELVRQHSLTQRQIAWRRKQWKTLRSLAAQEYAEDANGCFLASGECVFDLEAVEEALTHAAPASESKDNERLLIWLPPNSGKWEYIIGADTAGGGSEGDYCCAQVIERSKGSQCAELRGHFPPAVFARQLVDLGKKYNNALLAVERNNQGYGVIENLKNLGYENIYTQKGQEGFLTSVVTRPAMIENLAAILVAEPTLFQSERLLDELKTFVRHADGHAAAAEGLHDDCVMAMAIALEVRKQDAGRGAKKKALEMASMAVG